MSHQKHSQHLINHLSSLEFAGVGKLAEPGIHKSNHCCVVVSMKQCALFLASLSWLFQTHAKIANCSTHRGMQSTWPTCFPFLSLCWEYNIDDLHFWSLPHWHSHGCYPQGLSTMKLEQNGTSIVHNCAGNNVVVDDQYLNPFRGFSYAPVQEYLRAWLYTTLILSSQLPEKQIKEKLRKRNRLLYISFI